MLPGNSDLPGDGLCDGSSDVLPADLCGYRGGEDFPVSGSVSEDYCADSADLSAAQFLWGIRCLRCFLAEPVADTMAALTTTTLFFIRLRKLSREIEKSVH